MISKTAASQASSEHQMGAPVIAFRTSPTSRSVSLARAWGMTLAGYIRRGGFRVYAGEERVGD